MDRLRIVGGQRLFGKLRIEGAKNALLPVMAASLLTDQKLTILNAPPLSDIKMMRRLLETLGVYVEHDTDMRTLELRAAHLENFDAPYDIVRKMRASILVLGPLLARYGQASVSLPGGCAIGNRPVDFHVKALQALGASLELREGYIHASAPRGLRGATYTFPKVSVTGTMNLLMAGTLAEGTTQIKNAAREPEVRDLVRCLRAMGAKIEERRPDHLVINGVATLEGVTHRVIPDRIEMGTYILTAAITGGELFLEKGTLKDSSFSLELFKEVGIQLKETPDGVHVSSPPPDELKSVNVTTEPFPGFPTDLQAQFMALMTLTQGTSIIREHIFENRFMHVAELVRMGADIEVEGSVAVVKGVSGLKGAPLMATDLRASVSLIMAALAAKGETFVNRIYHLDRGYFVLESKLAACGAHIERITGDPLERASA